MNGALRHTESSHLPRSLLRPGSSSSAVRSESSAVTGKGFRPFFVLAAVFAVAIVPLWLLVLHGTLRPSLYLDATSWHAHEMIFGFVVAVIAGFLLTAVGNWTQRETAVGLPLLALAALWFSGRLVMGFSAVLPRGLVALADLAFLPALAVALGRPLVAARNRRNFVMLAILGALFVANLRMHLEALGLARVGSARSASLVSVDLVLLIISIVAGRVFPTFTRNATGQASIRSIPSLDALAIGTMALVTVVDAFAPRGRVAAVLAGCAGLLAAARALHWGARYSLQQPLLWVLHAGYAWLVLGLVLRGVGGVGIQGAGFETLATHALTVGAIGTLTLGMMARVSLGHTGRMLVASPSMAVAFVAINLAAVARVFVPMVAPEWYFGALVATGTLWSAAFVTFLIVHTPMLVSPRVDGRPG